MNAMREAIRYEAYTSEMYREFHRIPERSRFEVKTHAKIREELSLENTAKKWMELL